MNRSRELIIRFISSALLIPVLIYLLFFSKPILLTCFLIAIGCWGLYEFYQLISKNGIQPFKIVGYITLISILYFSEKLNAFNQFYLLFLWIIFLFCLISYILQKRKSNTSMVMGMGITVLGVIYLSLPFSLISVIHIKVYGAWYILWLLLVTWFGDSGAYIIGSTFGKHKLIPSISPGKTVEGFIGGILTSIIVAMATWLLIGYKFQFIDFGFWENLFLALALSLFGVVGDLVESVLKRQANKKDSGNLFPGHGGILDVIDSLLFTAPLFYYLVILLL